LEISLLSEFLYELDLTLIKLVEHIK